jgi:hypothetical protein
MERRRRREGHKSRRSRGVTKRKEQVLAAGPKIEDEEGST